MITPNNYGHFLNLTSFVLSFDLSRAYSRQNNCLALLDHVKITDLQITTGLNPVVSLIKSKLLKLFGQIKCSQKCLSKVCIEGKVQGKRWLDNVKKWTGLSIDKLNVATQDRGVWKDIKGQAMLVRSLLQVEQVNNIHI